MRTDYYEDQRYCATCDAYVFYLLSPKRAYCSYCGTAVSLFSESDLAAFRSGFARGRWDRRESEMQDAR